MARVKVGEIVPEILGNALKEAMQSNYNNTELNCRFIWARCTVEFYLQLLQELLREKKQLFLR